MTDENRIQGKVVVITGASSGLGEAAARHLSVHGATTVLGARRADRIRSLAKELTDQGAKALAVQTDVTRRDQVQALVDVAVQTYGRIDVLLNNAGLMPHSPLERLKVEDWERMEGVLYGIAAALPHMKKQKAGHIVNVSSVAGHKVRPGGGLRRDEACRAGSLGGAADGGEALQHPHDRDLAGRGRDGARRQHHRA
jgi:NADP-dependent 3-hydroxy acid dehydrogenase YdfG